MEELVNSPSSDTDLFSFSAHNWDSLESFLAAAVLKVVFFPTAQGQPQGKPF